MSKNARVVVAAGTAMATLALVASVTPASAESTGADASASVKVKDHTTDGESRQLDVAWVTATATDTRVKLRIKVANLTARNTREVKVNGDWRSPIDVQVLVAFDGDKDQYFYFHRRPGDPKGHGYAAHRYGDGFIDCAATADDFGITYAANVRTDVVTMSFPTDCLIRPGTTVAVSGRTSDSSQSGMRHDVVSKRAGGTSPRWSAALTVN